MVTTYNSDDFASLFLEARNNYGKKLSSGQEAKSSSTKEEKSKEPTGLKELLGLLKDLNGLPSDNSIISKYIERLYSNISSDGADSIDTNGIILMYIKALGNIKQALNSKEEYNDVKDTVKSKDGLHEIAVDSYGNMFVLDKETGEINNVTIELFKLLSRENPEQYEALTNSNLLYYRRNDPRFSFRDDILDIVSNGIGSKEITARIKEVISSLGSDSVKRGSYSYEEEQVSEGIKILLEAEDKDIKLSELSKDSQKLAYSALQYLWATLPNNAKAVLKYKTEDGTDESAIKLINSLIFSKTSTTNFVDESLKGSGKGSGKGKGSSEKGDSNDKVNWYTGVQTKDNGTYGRIQINKGTQFSMFVDGTVYGNIKDNDWNPIGNASVAEVMNSGLSGIVKNMHGISFGDKLLDPEDLNDIMYDNGGGIVVDLPIKVVKGIVTVDFDILEEFNAAKLEYDSKKGNQDDPELFAKILEAHNLDELLDNDGLPNRKRFGQFLIISGIGVDKHDKFCNNNTGGENELIEKVDKPDDALIDLLEKTLSTDNKKSNYEVDEKSIFPGDWFGNYDNIYRGNIFIPITENLNASLMAGKNEIPYYIQNENERRYQIIEKRKNANDNIDASLLNM